MLNLQDNVIEEITSHPAEQAGDFITPTASNVTNGVRPKLKTKGENKPYFVLVPIDKNIDGLNLKAVEGTLVELPSRAKAKTIAELVDGVVLAPMNGGV